jgi:hypothetical protein
MGAGSQHGQATTGHRGPALLAAAAAAAVVLLFAVLAGNATAAVGISSVSRHGGEAGDAVKLTLACGFCFPPCEGPKGQRHPAGYDHGPCMMGTKEDPPQSFGISLVPLARAKSPADCGAGRCPPRSPRPPRRAPYRFLGEATPPPGGNNPEHGDAPRYILDFEIPELAPGSYAYVIWCDVCLRGSEGALLTSPASKLWRLRVREPSR